jgi:hypothetical protein
LAARPCGFEPRPWHKDLAPVTSSYLAQYDQKYDQSAQLFASARLLTLEQVPATSLGPPRDAGLQGKLRLCQAGVFPGLPDPDSERTHSAKASNILLLGNLHGAASILRVSDDPAESEDFNR